MKKIVCILSVVLSSTNHASEVKNMKHKKPEHFTWDLSDFAKRFYNSLYNESCRAIKQQTDYQEPLTQELSLPFSVSNPKKRKPEQTFEESDLEKNQPPEKKFKSRDDTKKIQENIATETRTDYINIPKKMDKKQTIKQ